MFEFSFHIFFLYVVANVEASLHGTRVSFLTDQFAFLGLIFLVESLCGTDDKITIVQLDGDFLFLKARQINV